MASPRSVASSGALLRWHDASVTSVPGPLRDRGALRPAWQRRGLALVAVVVGLVVLWVVLGLVIGSSRGLDLSDEGLYLLAADPPSLQAAWGFPFGWHTRPLFWAVGYDIATFRTLGALVLVLCTGWLGWVAASVVIRRRPVAWSPSSRWFAVVAAAAGGIGSLIYYSSMLRTPSYNWLNIVGVVVSAAAVLVVVGRADATRFRARWRSVLPAAVSSLVLFATFPAKPTTLPIMLVLTTLLLLIDRGWRRATWWAAWNIVLMPLWLVLAVVTRVWPTDFLHVFRLALQMPAPDPLQTSGSAVRSALLLPRDVVAGVAGIGDRPALLLIAGLIVLAVPVVQHRRWLVVRLGGFAMCVLAAIAVAGVPVRVLSPNGQALGLAHAPLMTGTVIVLASAVLLGLRLSPTGEGSAHRRLRWSTVVFVALLSVVFSFGSGNGIYPQAAVASGLVLLAAVLAVARPRITRERLIAGIAVLAATALFAAAAIASGWRYPYRSAPLTEQQVSTAIGDHGARLQLDPVLAATITGLQEQGAAAGWKPGTPLVDVSYTWNPAIAAALGARVPDFLQLTIFGYSAAHDITAFHLTEPYRDFPFPDAWLLTTRSSLLDPGAQSAVAFTMERLSKVTGRAFPASYSCVASGQFVLWRPVDVATQAKQDCNG
jgi:hypothetical protein